MTKLYTYKAYGYVVVKVIFRGVMKRIVFKLLSYIYRMVIAIRHWLFDINVLKSQKFNIPIICVGNITVGGTGKTPTAEMIIDTMKPTYKVALLSRGYGRRTKGYREVTLDSSYRDVGDEPLQIKLKFPDVLVVVCEKRVEAIRRIEAEHPEINLIVMDDGFQHRHVDPRINVVVLDYTRPVFEDDFLPVGNLRDNLNSLYRAHYFIVTKCPEDMQPLDQRMWRKDLQLVAYQKIYFTRVVPTAAVPLFQTPNHLREGDEVIVMSGIGNPKPFIKSVRKHYNVVANLVYPDHHVYTVEDIEKIVSHIKQHPNAMLLTTEKDAVKLRRSRRVPDLRRERLFYQPVKVEFLEGSDENFFETLKSDLLGKVHLGDLTIGGNKEN